MVVTAGVFATQEALEADPTLARARPHRGLRQHRALLRGGAPPPARSRAGARSASSARWRASEAASPSSSTARPRPASPTTSRASTIASTAQGLRVVCVKPGFVRTSMTEGLPAPPFAGEPEARGARWSCAPSTAGTPVVYAPGRLAPRHGRHPRPAPLRHAEGRFLARTIHEVRRTSS